MADIEPTSNNDTNNPGTPPSATTNIVALPEVHVPTEISVATPKDSKTISTTNAVAAAAAVAVASAAKRKRTTPPITTAAAAAANTSSASKKRPYRRTKRPKNYCDKSTVTKTSSEPQTSVNVYDAVLGEAEDLLQAAMEAQQLGRLKMASAYQMLLHARLVGLGKRFDRATIALPKKLRKDEEDDEEGTPASAKDLPAGSTPKGMETPQQQQQQSKVASPQKDGSIQNLPPALQQLSNILPSNLEMDTTMMEHLARAAVELHHQRTGRKKSAEGLLASPMNGFLASTPESNTTASNTTSSRKKSTIAWTDEEAQTVQQHKDEPITAISKLVPTKTEAQIKAYLKNCNKKTVDSDEFAVANDDGDDDDEPKKRGGRGRKPPTTAMNTVPNANVDIRSLLQGRVLQST